MRWHLNHRSCGRPTDIRACCPMIIPRLTPSATLPRWSALAVPRPGPASTVPASAGIAEANSQCCLLAMRELPSARFAHLRLSQRTKRSSAYRGSDEMTASPLAEQQPLDRDRDHRRYGLCLRANVTLLARNRDSANSVPCRDRAHPGLLVPGWRHDCFGSRGWSGLAMPLPRRQS